MRIAHVTHVKDGHGGGIDRHIFNLATAQKGRGDDPIVVATAPGDLTAAFEEYGIRVVIEPRLYARSMPPGSAADPETGRVVDGLCALFENVAAEVVHCHFPNLGNVSITAGNRIGIPSVYTNHVYKAFAVPKLDFDVITVGRNAFRQLRDDGFPAERLHYVPNGTKTVPRVLTESPTPSLMWVGRMEPVKAPDLAILAMADLKHKRGRECPVLNIYGKGGMEGHLKEMVAVLRLGDVVRFHGVQQGILERCRATDLLIVSSREEAGPLVVLEAMSRGMPIVATRVGEIGEMIPDRRYGNVVMSGSITALADGIESMLADIRARRFDPELPISRHRDLYTVEKMAEGVAAAYECMIARNSPH
jgi:glycosyltransferase involved in cell wall biosynthesis